MTSNNSCNNSQFDSAMNFNNFETKLRRQRQVKPKGPCNKLQFKSIITKMTSRDSHASKIPDKDAAGTQLKPKRPVEVSNLLNKILIPPPDGGLIPITANSKNSPRLRTRLWSQEAARGITEVDLLSQIEINGGPRKSNEENFQYQTQVQLITAQHPQAVEMAAAATIGY